MAIVIVKAYFMNQKKSAVYYGGMGLYRDGLEKACLFYHHNFLPETMINHPSCFVSREIYERYGRFDTHYKIVADYDFMLRLYHKDRSLFYPIYKRIANFTEGSLSGGMAAELETDLLRKKYGMISKKKYIMRKIVRTVKKWIGY